MKRLTKRCKQALNDEMTKFKKFIEIALSEPKYHEKGNFSTQSTYDIYETNRLYPMADKLAEYEDLEENGLLLKLPCKAGDTVYIVSRQEVIPLKINGIYVNENSIAMYGVNEQHYGYGKVTLYSNKTPIEWFTTKEEAEDFLKSLENKRK